MPLSPRLSQICQQLIPDQDVWDVCCDHGYVGLQALAWTHFPQVYFVDQVPHILEKVFQKIPLARRHQAQMIAKPAEHIKTSISGNLVIAGVGGLTILRILNSWTADQKLQCRRLILAPQDHVEEMRQVPGPGVSLVKQLQVIERGRKRPIFVFDREFQTGLITKST